MPDDTDALTYKDASAAVTALDLAYRAANINDKVKLKAERDKAYNALSQARLRLLEDGVITTSADVEEMKLLRKELEDAADVQTIAIAAGRVAGFLLRLAV